MHDELIVSTSPTLDSPPSVSLPAPSQAPAELIIEAKKGWIAIDWKEMLHFRELLFFLIWRDVKVRYKQSVLGVTWAILQPTLQMLINTLIFGVILGQHVFDPATGRLLPYPIYVFIAQLPWQLFSGSMGTGGMSLLNQQHLLTKIYFPRLFIPTAAVGGLLVDMAISTCVLVVLIFIYHMNPAYQFTPSINVCWIPLLVLMTLILGLGVAYLLSALTVTYRDFRFLVPFTVQILMYLSFVGYPLPATMAAKHPVYTAILAMNPMFDIIDGFRSAMFGLPWHFGRLAVALVMSIPICILGMFYFRKTERRFADIA